jgi:hypothetical protein
MDIRIQDEALFVAPGSGALWSYDFGSNTRVIREGQSGDTDPPFQVAQARADDLNLLLVFPTLGSPSVAEQDSIRTLLRETVGDRGVAFILDQTPGHVAVVGSDAELVEHFAAAVAVVRTCWGWDDSQAFTVNVDELEFHVAPSFDGEVWTALVRRGRER